MLIKNWFENDELNLDDDPILDRILELSWTWSVVAEKYDSIPTNTCVKVSQTPSFPLYILILTAKKFKYAVQRM